MSRVAQNLEGIRKKIGNDVKILGVVKHQTNEIIFEGIKAGINILGVNYVQEAERQRQFLRNEKIEWHFIGHIQSRKVKNLLDYDCIESIDRWEIAEGINKQLEPFKRAIYVMVEVNIGEEPQKSGVPSHRLGELLAQVSELPNLKLIGLMSLPPALQPVESRRPYFKKMRSLFDQYKKEYHLEFLSMGTSDDFEIAVQEGSNLIRLGTSLFGERKTR